MASVCIQSCVDDARVPIRATYVNLYKWPESDAEFVKTTVGRRSSNARRGSGTGGGGDGGGGGHHHHHHHNHPRVVDSISCRQMYLRSYTFSRKETVQEKTKKCIGRVRERVANGRKRTKIGSGGGGGGGGGGVCLRKPCVVIRKAKEVSCAALSSIFRRLLSCTTRVDVVDQRDCS